MKKKEDLIIFNSLSTSTNQDWLSLMGSKYHFSLGFSFDFTKNFQEANVFILDEYYQAETLEIVINKLNQLSLDRVLLVICSQFNTQLSSYGLRKLSMSHFKILKVESDLILPEDILEVLSQCYEIINESSN